MESKAEDLSTSRKKPDIARIKSGEVVTLGIEIDKFPDYLKTGLATGFRVTKIADEGEKYPTLSRTSGGYGMRKMGFLRRSKLVEWEGHESFMDTPVCKKGYIAIAIERSKDTRDHKPFWTFLKAKMPFAK